MTKITTTINVPSFAELRHVHIIGVCGTLMGAFAAFLKRRGISVSGSDQNVYPPMSDVLRNSGVTLFEGYRAENLEAVGQRPDLVVIGNVIRADNSEAQAAINGGYAFSSLPEAMEKLLLKDTRNLVVAGTHGKTTTSSLLAHVLVSAGRDPNYFIGGVSHDLPFGFHLSGIDAGRFFVLEGDEYDTAFWAKVPKFNYYLPDDVILTSIEYDHADIYPDMHSVIRAFTGLIERIRPGGRLIACLDYPVIGELSRSCRAELLTYASDDSRGARFVPGSIRIDEEWTRFDVLDRGRAVDSVAIRLSGRHNILNALSAWIVCRAHGLSEVEIGSGMSSFRGVKRRQEVRGDVGGITVIDDFAHHPTAVRETLSGLKARYPQRRLAAVFEPRSATSRRKIFQVEYATAFMEADSVFLATPFDQSRIAEDDRFSSEQLAADISSGGRSASVFRTIDAGVAEVVKFSRSGDVVVILSNGGFGGFIQKLLETLTRRLGA